MVNESSQSQRFLGQVDVDWSLATHGITLEWEIEINLTNRAEKNETHKYHFSTQNPLEIVCIHCAS